MIFILNFLVILSKVGFAYKKYDQNPQALQDN